MKFFKSFVVLLLFYSVAVNAMDSGNFQTIMVKSDQGIKVIFNFRQDDTYSNCIVCTVVLERDGGGRQSTDTRTIKLDIDSCSAILDQFKPQELLERFESRKDCGLCSRRDIGVGVLLALVGIVLGIVDLVKYRSSGGLPQILIGISILYCLLIFIGCTIYCICRPLMIEEERRPLLDETQSLPKHIFLIKNELLEAARQKLQGLKIVVTENKDELICTLQDGDTCVVQVE